MEMTVECALSLALFLFLPASLPSLPLFIPPLSFTLSLPPSHSPLSISPFFSSSLTSPPVFLSFFLSPLYPNSLSSAHSFISYFLSPFSLLVMPFLHPPTSHSAFYHMCIPLFSVFFTPILSSRPSSLAHFPVLLFLPFHLSLGQSSFATVLVSFYIYLFDILFFHVVFILSLSFPLYPGILLPVLPQPPLPFSQHINIAHLTRSAQNGGGTSAPPHPLPTPPRSS